MAQAGSFACLVVGAMLFGVVTRMTIPPLTWVAWGRVLGVADYFAEGDRTLTVQMPLGGVPTLYARIGDLFAWLCVAGVVLAVGTALVSR